MRIKPEAKDLPDSWYNIIPDLDFEMPPLMSPASGYPLTADDLSPVASYPIVEQELERKNTRIPIPPKVRQAYEDWRPTAVYRAERLERKLDTPARIFYKYEGGSPSGSHEANTAIAQAYYAAAEKVGQLVTATGNGEWGISLAIACNNFGIRCKIYMVRSSYDENLHARYMMQILGAEVVSSPSPDTPTGAKVLAENPDTGGSLGIALSEAFEEAYSQEDMKFCWGTVMNHVLLHQTVIGLEAEAQMSRIKAYPDVIIGAVGGGSGFGGLVLPFLRDSKRRPEIVAVETAAAPSLSKGRYAYDYGDYKGIFALLKMYTLGHGFVPPGLLAGGMRYHGISPLVSALYREKAISAKIHTQKQAFEAAGIFARAEGFIPSPESSYTLAEVMGEAVRCRETKKEKVILFPLSQNTNLDTHTFKNFIDGAIAAQPFMENDVQKALAELPEVKG